MEEFLIKESSLNVMKQFIGKEFSTIVTNTLNYDLDSKQFDTFETVLFKVDGKFIKLNIEEMVGIGFEDDFQLNFEVKNTPEPFEYFLNEYDSIVYQQPVSTIAVWKKIKSICLLSVSEERFQRNIFSKMIFHLEHNESICLTPTIPLKLKFNDENLENTIKNSIYKYTL